MHRTIVKQWPDPPPAWPEDLRKDFAASLGNGHVGSKLVSETDRVRVWHLSLDPGERIGFHTHVLDYFWTAMTGGRARSHYANGKVQDVAYEPGDTKHHAYGPGEFTIHDLENIGRTTLLFTTVEFIDSANEPLALNGDGSRSR
jgi:hypothetical protein